MRPRQTPEPITIDELSALAEQLKDAAEVLRSTIETMRSKNKTQLDVLYRQTTYNLVKPLNRSRESIYEAWRALQAGKTVAPSARSVSVKIAKREVLDAVAEEAAKLEVSRKKKSR